MMEFANLNVNVNPPFFRPLHHGQEKIDESRYPLNLLKMRNCPKFSALLASGGPDNVRHILGT
jgi:hypothetical protein